MYAAVAFGLERTPEQDPLFAFRIVVDVASRALSPAVNDPTTAVLAIDQLHFLLRQVGLRHLDTNHFCDRDGNLRLMFRTPGWEDYVLIAVSEVRLFGGGSIQVARRLRAMLENLSASLPEERRPALREQLRLLAASVHREFAEVFGAGASLGHAHRITVCGGRDPVGTGIGHVDPAIHSRGRY